MTSPEGKKGNLLNDDMNWLKSDGRVILSMCAWVTFRRQVNHCRKEKGGETQDNGGKVISLILKGIFNVIKKQKIIS